MAQIAPDFRMHYVSAGSGSKTAVLLHGFPQTWWEWRHVIRELSGAGFRIIAPDYRGAGHSWRPLTGYDKRTMAKDIRTLLRDELAINGPVALVGHDIGLMVAYAFAQDYRSEVSHLVVIDAPLPGTTVFERLRTDPRLWHFGFHAARDVAEMLVAGRERAYLDSFINARIFNRQAIDNDDLTVYTAAYSSPGGLRAAFETYRAFEIDSRDNLDALRQNGKLTIPTLAVHAAISNSGPLVEEMMHEVAMNVRGARIERSAHWIPEENPKDLAHAILGFLLFDAEPER